MILNALARLSAVAMTVLALVVGFRAAGRPEAADGILALATAPFVVFVAVLAVLVAGWVELGERSSLDD